MSVTFESPAKINLFLKVTGKRADGYHELKSIFQKVSISDTLVFDGTDSGEIELACDDPSIPVDGGNLVVKAALALREAAGVSKGIKIELSKKIPVAAGLGGGSSNAAVTLAALNEIWQAGLGPDRLNEIAFSIGADVPFFLGGPMAMVGGAGEKIEPLNAKKSAPLLLVNPGFGISAGEAYKNSEFDFAPAQLNADAIADFESGDPARMAKHMTNDLELWAVKAYPELARLKSEMEKTGALKVMMTGSGPTLMAFYQDGAALDDAKSSLAGVAPFIERVETLIG